MKKSPFSLRLKSLRFLSAVDSPAQSAIAHALIFKRDSGEVTLTAKVAKLSDELGLVFGYAFASSLDGGTTPYVDAQNDAIDPDFLKAAMDFVAGGGATDINHDGHQDGRVIFAWPLLPDINMALGIESKTVGLAVAIKPSAATFAKFKSGELTGFSIEGTGAREPLAKSDVTKQPKHVVCSKCEKSTAPLSYCSNCGSALSGDEKPPVAASGASADELEDQADKAIAHKLWVAKQLAEHLDYLDGIAASSGVDAARTVAERNVSSVGNWGAVWLEKRGIASQAGDASFAQIVKAAFAVNETARKGHREKVAAAQRTFDGAVAELATKRGITNDAARAIAMNFPTIKALHADWQELDQSVPEGLVDIAQPYTKAIDDKIGALQRERVSHIEATAAARNLGIYEAELALVKGKTADAAHGRESQLGRLEREIAEAQDERSTIRTGITERVAALSPHHIATDAAQSALLAKRAELATIVNESPGGRLLRKAVERFQKEHKVPTYAQAMARALVDDEVVRELWPMRDEMPATADIVAARKALAELDREQTSA